MHIKCYSHVPQCIKTGSGRKIMFGATAIKDYFLYGAFANAFFIEDTNLSTSRKFAQILSATWCNHWARQVMCVIFGNITLRAVPALIIKLAISVTNSNMCSY